MNLFDAVSPWIHYSSPTHDPCWQSAAPGDATFDISHCYRCSDGSQLFQYQSSCQPYEASYSLQLEVVGCYLGIFDLGIDHRAWLWSEIGHGQCRITGGEKGGGGYFLCYFLKSGHSKKIYLPPVSTSCYTGPEHPKIVDRPVAEHWYGPINKS